LYVQSIFVLSLVLLFTPISCKFATLIFLLQILNGSTHEKEFILKLIMDTVNPVDLIPVMVRT
jgi:hypothetical protein